jgi:hypothetical protein
MQIGPSLVRRTHRTERFCSPWLDFPQISRQGPFIYARSRNEKGPPLLTGPSPRELTSLCARRFGSWLSARLHFRPAAHSEVRILLLARRHDLGVNLRQRLGGRQPLRRAHHDWPNAVHRDPDTTLGAFGDKARLFACCRDLGARAAPLWRRLNGRSRRRRSGLWQRWTQQAHKEKTSQYRGCTHDCALC